RDWTPRCTRRSRARVGRHRTASNHPLLCDCRGNRRSERSRDLVRRRRHSTSRLTFVRDYGTGQLFENFASTWPLAVWSLAGAGWIIVIAVLRERPQRRLIASLTAFAAFVFLIVALTVDTSRVAMLCTLAPLLVIAANAPTR